MPAPWKGGWGRMRGFGRGWWNQPQPATPYPVDPTVYTGKAAEILRNAKKGEPYTYPGGTIIPLVKDGVIVGELWSDIDLSKATVGWIRPCRWGITADIVYEGRVVGLVYVEGYPPGRGWGPGWGFGRGWWRWTW